MASDWAAAAAVLCPHGSADEPTELRSLAVSRAVQDGQLHGVGMAERKKARVRALIDEGQYRPDESGG